MCNCPHCNCDLCKRTNNRCWDGCVTEMEKCKHDWKLVFHTYSENYEKHYYEFYCTKCLEIKKKESKDVAV